MLVLLKHNCEYRDDGVGLAAPQVGVNVRLMVYNPTGRRGDEEYILVNPKILHTSGKRDTAEEGCLSFPRLFADVEVSAQLEACAAVCWLFIPENACNQFTAAVYMGSLPSVWSGLKDVFSLLCQLSCPDRLHCMALQRPQRVKVRAQSVKGETLMLTLTDWQARIFQHEYDHLQVCAAPALPSSKSFSSY